MLGVPVPLAILFRPLVLQRAIIPDMRVSCVQHYCRSIKVFAIYQILFGWKTYKYYYETDELPQLGHFFPAANNFSWVGIGFM